MSRRLLLFAAAAGATAVLSTAQNAPTIEADGKMLTMTVPEGGDIALQIGSVATSMSDFSQGTNAQLAELVDEISSVKTDMLSSTQDNSQRIDGLEKQAGEMMKRQSVQAGLITDLQAIASAVTQLQSAVSTALDCDADGKGCTAKLDHLPSCDARVLPDDFVWEGDHGQKVPLGVVATRQCTGAQFIPADRATITCKAAGWTKIGAECKDCSQNCAVCSSSNMCSVCGSGFELNYDVPRSDYSQAKLDASNVMLSSEHRPVDVGRDEFAYDPRTAQTRRACVVDGNKDKDSWVQCPNYHAQTCNGIDAPYVTLDLKQVVHVGKVRAFHYTDTDFQRTYCKQTIELSTTGAFAGEQHYVHDERHLGPNHPESTNGVEVDARGVPARFVRHRASRSTLNEGVHFVELEVDTAPMSKESPVGISCVKME